MSVTPASSQRSTLMALMLRLHFYLGLFIGPFILLAALSGTLYVLTPQLENRLYAHLLFTDSQGAPRSLEQQIFAAQRVAGVQTPLVAVRPAPSAGQSTRVMFSDATLKAGENRALFIDPVTLAVLGEATVYGTSGALPLRMTIDYLHSGTLFGPLGRYYSELAASWLWVAALGGVALWVLRKPSAKKNLRRRHATLGVVLLPLLLLFSATGLTWSQWAGENISQIRQWLHWQSPALNTGLGAVTAQSDEHAHHGTHTALSTAPRNPWPGLFDGVLLQARLHGIDAARVEIRPPAAADRAWTVSEIDRSWPTQVDAMAIDASNFKILDRLAFAQYPLVGKLIRWGIDAHMGVLFGVINQLLLALFGIALCLMIVWGYLMWWRRLATLAITPPGTQGIVALWRRLPWRVKGGLLPLAAFGAWLMPLLWLSLLLLLLLDSALSRRR
ncbi:PepSY-associated TM helix domain-containing protein [Serratia odorifera]|uniref:PepSY-associated TM helix domain-containing protein n=1 Tax=Serratia odorifera TaxID=618 RepID=UPI002361AA47|nr:PepSY-associated TM helix domain-containing protein [Serratia odorifera]